MAVQTRCGQPHRSRPQGATGRQKGMAGTGHGKVDELIRRAGVERTVRLTVPHFVSVGHILQRTALVGVEFFRPANRPGRDLYRRRCCDA